MVAAERELFVTGLRALASTFRIDLGGAPGAATIEGYWQALEELELRHVGVALRRAIKESRFFPPPAELLAFGRHAKATESPSAAETRSQRLLGAVERKRVRESWRNAAKQTNGEMLKGVLENLQEAEQRLARLSALYRDLPIGDDGRLGNAADGPLLHQLSKAKADVEHWRGYVAFWRAKCVEEGDDKVAGAARAQQQTEREQRMAEFEAWISRRMNDPAFFGQETEPGADDDLAEGAL